MTKFTVKTKHVKFVLKVTQKTLLVMKVRKNKTESDPSYITGELKKLFSEVGKRLKTHTKGHQQRKKP